MTPWPEIPVNWPPPSPGGRQQLLNANFYTSEPAFAALLRERLGAHYPWLEGRLNKIGEECAATVAEIARICDAHTPELVHYDQHGNRIDRVDYHPQYREMERVGYGSGQITLKYDPENRRVRPGVLHTAGFGLGYVFSKAESGMYCPLCMTDGVARVLDKFGGEALKAKHLPALTASDPAKLARGCMFLTEKQGGSDVGANVCTATPDGQDYVLHGEKWFCSNLGGELMLVLARVPGAPPGTKGLGLFLVERDLGGKRNGMLWLRAKDKLGTRSMATGEVHFTGARAALVGDPHQGFKYMSEMLNLSRLYNSVASISVSSRALAEAHCYLTHRRAFGKPAFDLPLLRETLADAFALHWSAAYFVFEVVHQLDRHDADPADEAARKLVRVLTPLAKRYTGKLAVALCSEAIEFIGGPGFINDFATPRLLREAQVLPIWEGTSNVLALDVLRALVKEGAGAALLEAVRKWLRSGRVEGEDATGAALDGLATGLAETAQVLAKNPAAAEAGAGAFADSLSLLAVMALMWRDAAGRGENAVRSRAALRRLHQMYFTARAVSGLRHRSVTADDFDVLVRGAVLNN